MENYIVRIYRRDSSDPEQVNGVLESVELDTRRPFTNLNSLNSMLAGDSKTTTSAPTGNNTQTKLSLAK